MRMLWLFTQAVVMSLVLSVLMIVIGVSTWWIIGLLMVFVAGDLYNVVQDYLTKDRLETLPLVSGDVEHRKE